jgi:hypothetical protein
MPQNIFPAMQVTKAGSTELSVLAGICDILRFSPC